MLKVSTSELATEGSFDSVVVKIQGGDAPIEASSSSQVKPETTQARFEHMEQYMQSQFTYLNQY